MSDPVFLPYIRRGLSQSVGVADPLSGPLPSRASVTATVDLVDSTGATASSSTTRSLAGPGDVRGIDEAQILRREPPPGTVDFETTRIAFVELLAPALPWLLTPAAPTAEGGLRPWLVLIVVEESDGVRFSTRSDGVQVLDVDADHVAAQLWDLADSHVWTHAQSSADDLDASLAAGRGEVIARLMCPRKLKVAHSYRAALVPAFDAGVAAGLGQPIAPGEIHPAWDLDDPAAVTLPVYATWTFATSDQPGDFESLAIRLRPDVDAGRMGFRPARLETGAMLPTPTEGLDMAFEFAGALVDPGEQAEPLARATRDWVRKELAGAIDAGQHRTEVPLEAPAGYDPADDDPVLAPQLYGRWPAGVETVPERGWVTQVNLPPAARAAAAVGADVVRQAEHELLAAAWDQVGALREAAVEIGRTRLAAEVADRQHARLASLDDATLLFTMAPATRHIPMPRGIPGVGGTSAVPGLLQRRGRTVAEAIAGDPVIPTGTVSAAFFRAARRGSAIHRQPTLPVPGAGVSGTVGSGTSRPALATRVAATFVSAAAIRPDAELSPAKAFRASFVPDGAVVTGQTMTRRASVAPGLLITEPADVMRAASPRTAAVAATAARLDGVDIDRAFPEDGGRSRIVVGPWFPDGLAPRLQAMSPELLLPGVGAFGMDRVRLLEINEEFVAAFLVGANHEWSREALWREFPADLSATAFASLFDRPGDPPAPGEDTDLHTELADVGVQESLRSMIGGEGSGTVLLIRAELIRRFPGIMITLLEPVDGNLPLTADGALIPERVMTPMFVGEIDAATRFVGFDIDPDDVLGDGWFVSLEEPASGPRFGFDGGRRGPRPTPPGRWTDLTWADVLQGDTEATHVRMGPLGWQGEERNGITWGRNGAHQARIAYQQPFRMVFPASALIVRHSQGPTG